MPKGLDLLGKRFGMLTVVGMESGSHGRRWHCICDCGMTKDKPLTSYELKVCVRCHCGCALKSVRNGMLTHGQSGTRLYKVWSAMKHRCSNPNDKHFANYGGRGVRVCGEWQSFESFWLWAQDSGYALGLTIERMDSNGNYEPANCAWIPKPEQSNNTRRCRLIRFQNQTKNLMEWAKELGVSYALIQSRITKLGWGVERALTEPAVAPGRCQVRLIEYNGEEKSVAEWARAAGLPYGALTYRLKVGWPIGRALTQPLDPRAIKRKAATVYVAAR